MTTEQSRIGTNAKGDAVSFSGPAAVDLFRAAALASALCLLSKGLGFSSRMMGKTQMLKEASKYTGKTYKRGEYLKAKDDLSEVIAAKKAAIPYERIV